jgi:hypothetical protein
MSEAKESWTEETVYDAEVAPLMARIIAICKEHKIPMAAVFQYQDTEDDGPGHVFTTLPFAGRGSPQMSRLFAAAQPERPVMLTETHVTQPDGSRLITIGRVR